MFQLRTVLSLGHDCHTSAFDMVFDPTHQDEHCFIDRYGGCTDVGCSVAKID